MPPGDAGTTHPVADSLSVSRARSVTHLNATATVNATRWQFHALKATWWSVKGGSGARTKPQRIAPGLAKESYCDKLRVGENIP